MKRLTWIFLLSIGCEGDTPPNGTPVSQPISVRATDPAPPSEPAPAPKPDPAPAPAPQADAQEKSQDPPDGRYCIKLSALAAHIPKATTVYFHDPIFDPRGDLFERPQSLRDIYRPEGTYWLGFERRGYERVKLPIRVTPKGVDPNPETLEPLFEPTKELVDNYDAALAALEQRDAARARAALEAVQSLDDGFRETPAKFDRLKALEREQAEALACLRKGDLENAAKETGLAKLIDETRRTRELWSQCVSRFDIDGAQNHLGKLQSSLTPEDPGNQQRKGRIDDLASIRSLLADLQNICLNPVGVEERLSKLFDETASDRAKELAESISRFCRHAQYSAILHEPASFVLSESDAEVRARLQARYVVAAGESAIETTVTVRLRKTETWKIIDYVEAQ
ncbi:MAG: hypothetical protein HYY16_02105 [Planctomycetes bacterium]|nr:hypothetical protein [Planctomycetota bacterium]